ncbi:MAG: hypothetical protein ACR2JB_20885 [Bryobacteraceae bacterium]
MARSNPAGASRMADSTLETLVEKDQEEITHAGPPFTYNSQIPVRKTAGLSWKGTFPTCRGYANWNFYAVSGDAISELTERTKPLGGGGGCVVV